MNLCITSRCEWTGHANLINGHEMFRNIEIYFHIWFTMFIYMHWSYKFYNFVTFWCMCIRGQCFSSKYSSMVCMLMMVIWWWWWSNRKSLEEPNISVSEKKTFHFMQQNKFQIENQPDEVNSKSIMPKIDFDCEIVSKKD